MTCIDCNKEIDIPVFRGEGFHQEGPFCAECAQDRARVEMTAQSERDYEENQRQIEMTRGMNEHIDADRERQRQRNIDYYRDRGLPVPDSMFR